MAIPGNLFSANDSSFETSVGGWTAGTATPTLTRDSAHAFDGTWALKAVAASAVEFTVLAPLTTITPARTFTYFYSIFTTFTGVKAYLGVDWKNSGTFVSSGTYSPASVTLTANTWTPFSLSALAPASGVNQGQVVIGVIPVNTGDAVWIDYTYLGQTLRNLPTCITAQSVARSGNY